MRGKEIDIYYIFILNKIIGSWPLVALRYTASIKVTQRILIIDNF